MSLTPPKNLSAVSLTPVNNFSAVSLTPAINFWLFGYFWPVSTTPGNNVIAGVVDTGDKLLTSVNGTGVNCIDDRGLLLLQNYPRPPILSLEQLWKRAKAPHKPWSEALEAAKVTSNQNGIISFGGLRGLWSRCVGYFWMQLFMAVPMTPSEAVADFGGRRYCRFIPFNFGSSPPPWRPCSCHRQ